MIPSDLTDEERIHADVSFSIEAEDIIVERIFYHMLGNPLTYQGFYVDLGACDPVRASNTHRLYRRGWRGLNVDANPDALLRFQAVRPRDTSLIAAVSESGGTGKYFRWNDPLLNGFLPDDIVRHHTASGYKILDATEIPLRAINDILAENIPVDITVDYLNIDIEMMEQRILGEWNYTRWRPQVISVEIHSGHRLSSIEQMPIARLLAERGYTFVSRIWHTSIFVDLKSGK